MGHLKVEKAKKYTRASWMCFPFLKELTHLRAKGRGIREMVAELHYKILPQHLNPQQTLATIIFIINKELEVYNFNPQFPCLLP